MKINRKSGYVQLPSGCRRFGSRTGQRRESSNCCSLVPSFIFGALAMKFPFGVAPRPRGSAQYFALQILADLH